MSRFFANEQYTKLNGGKNNGFKTSYKKSMQSKLSNSTNAFKSSNPSVGARRDYVSDAMQKALDDNNIEASVDGAEKPENEQIQKADQQHDTIGQLDEANQQKEKKELEGVKTSAKNNNAKRTGAGVNIGSFMDKKEGLAKGIAGSKLSGIANQLVNQAIGQIAAKLIGNSIGGLIGKVFEYIPMVAAIESGFGSTMKKMKSSQKQKTTQEIKSDSGSQKLQNATIVANQSQAIGSEVEQPNKENVKNIH